MSTLRTKSSNLAVFEWKVWNDLFCDGDLVQYLQIRNVHAWGISTQQSANPFVWKYIEEFENNWIAIEKSANLFGVEIYWRVWMHLRNATPSRLALYLQMWTPCVSMSLNGPLTFSHIACFVYNHKKNCAVTHLTFMFIAVAQNNYRIRIRISLCSKILNMSKQTLEQKKRKPGWCCHYSKWPKSELRSWCKKKETRVISPLL